MEKVTLKKILKGGNPKMTLKKPAAFNSRLFVYILILPFTLASCDFFKKWTSSETSSETSEAQQIEQQNNAKQADRRKAQVDFLNQNKNKEGVQSTSSGLQYKVLKKGEGKTPASNSRVEVHYQGTLIDGTEFDSSYKRGKTAQFYLDEVIRGWTEGLQLMKEGSTYEFYIPSSLAYGERNLPSIPAGSTLIFKVELIKVL